MSRIEVMKAIRVEAVPQEGGKTCWVHTHGMGKFKQPDFEIRDVQNFFVRSACGLLNEVCDYLLNGGGLRIKAGERMQMGEIFFQFKKAEPRKEDEKSHYYEGLRLEIVAVEFKCQNPKHQEIVKH